MTRTFEINPTPLQPRLQPRYSSLVVFYPKRRNQSYFVNYKHIQLRFRKDKGRGQNSNASSRDNSLLFKFFERYSTGYIQVPKNRCTSMRIMRLMPVQKIGRCPRESAQNRKKNVLKNHLHSGEWILCAFTWTPPYLLHGHEPHYLH